MKIRPVEAELFHADGQTGLETQIIRDFPLLHAGGRMYNRCSVKSSAYLSFATVLLIRRFLLHQAPIMTRFIKVRRDYKQTTYCVCICLPLLLLL